MSLSETDNVIIAKQSLMFALGDNWPAYLTNMKLWFRKKLSKDEFDAECRKLFTSDHMHCHNKFLLAMLNKIDAVSASQSVNYSSSYPTSPIKVTSNSKKRKRTSKTTDRATFEPANVYDFVPQEYNYDHITATQTNVPVIRYAAQELFLPDTALVMGRLLVGAWEAGLVTIEENAAELIANSVQVLLKNILTAVITKKKHYRATADGSFFYDVGHQLKHPFIRNTVTRRRVDDEPIELDKEITTVVLARTVNNDSVFLSSCEEVYPTVKKRIATYDVYKALLDKNVIPSHAVYSMNMEKISSLLS